MTVVDILPPSGLRRFVEGWIDTVAVGLHRLRRGGLHFNAPPPVSRALLKALTTLLRLALLILACHAAVAPLRPRGTQEKRLPPVRRNGASFRLFPPFRLRHDDDPVREAPPQFIACDRDPFRFIQRRLDMLARVLADPRPTVMRMARRLPTQLMVIGRRPPKRRRPAMTRDEFEELADAWAEAWFQLREFRRRTRDIEAKASAS